MANTLTAQVSASIAARWVLGFPVGTTTPLQLTNTFSESFTSSQVSKIYYNTLSVGTGGTTVDLTAAVDALGVTWDFASIQALIVCNRDATNALTLGGGTHPLFAALPNITAGGSFLLSTPITITGGTNNDLKFVSVAGTISVDVLVIG